MLLLLQIGGERRKKKKKRLDQKKKMNEKTKQIQTTGCGWRHVVEAVCYPLTVNQTHAEEIHEEESTFGGGRGRTREKSGRILTMQRAG